MKLVWKGKLTKDKGFLKDCKLENKANMLAR